MWTLSFLHDINPIQMTTNMFSAIAYDDDEEVVVTPKKEVTILQFKDGSAGIDLLAMFPDMKAMDISIKGGKSWYDICCREDEDHRFRNMPAIETDGWTDISSKKVGQRSYTRRTVK
jgi:hypothetical protein